MKSYKAVRDFNSCDEIVLYIKTRQNMLFSRKKKERKTNKQTAVVIKYVICGKVRLAFCTIWLLS